MFIKKSKFMELLLLIIFIQIFIESFPVSSSGHVELIQKVFNINQTIPDFFDHFLHGPTIFILIIFFRKQWFFPLKNLVTGIFDKSFRQKNSYKNLCKILFRLCGYLFITTIITTFFWFLIKVKLEKMAWFASDYTLLVGFFVTFIFLFLLWMCPGQPLATSRTGFNLKKILLIAFAQSFALIPGISRFASVYVTSRLLGINPRRAFQLTVLIQFPLLVPGFLLGFYKLIKIPGWVNLFTWQINLTIIVSTVLAYFGLCFVHRLALQRKLGWFFLYMLIPISVLIWLIAPWASRG